MFPSYLESGKYWFLAISSLTNTVAARSKEKDYDIYLKSEKLVHSQQDNEKIWREIFPNYLEVEKTGSQLFRT